MENAVSAFQPQQAFPMAGRDPTAQGGSTSPGRGVDGQHQCLVDRPGKPVRILWPQRAALGAHRPCASPAPSGGPAAASLTWLGRICHHDGSWWGAGDLLSAQQLSMSTTC